MNWIANLERIELLSRQEKTKSSRSFVPFTHNVRQRVWNQWSVLCGIRGIEATSWESEINTRRATCGNTSNAAATVILLLSDCMTWKFFVPEENLISLARYFEGDRPVDEVSRRDGLLCCFEILFGFVSMPCRLQPSSVSWRCHRPCNFTRQK